MTFFTPEKVRPENLKFFNITQAAYIFGAITHLLICIVFGLLGVREMVMFNLLFSLPVFTLAFFINRQGRHDLAFFIAFLELLFHQVAGVYYIGWEGGFQYILIYLAGLTFFNARWNKALRLFFISVLCFSFSVMYLDCRASSVYTLSQPMYDLFYLSASLLTLLSLALLINYYVRAAQTAENGLREANRQLSEKNIQIEHALQERDRALTHLQNELNEAAEYVRTILPQPIAAGRVRTDWRFIPSTSVGGDAFGYHWLDEDNFIIYLIDVSGHGVGPALLSVSVMNTLRSQSLPDTDFKDPARVLTALNKAFPGEENNDMFFTMWYGVYNKNSRELQYASGGHPPALLLNPLAAAGNKITRLRTPNYVIGGMPEINYKKATIQADKGSAIYIFSDGVYEIKKPDGVMWKLDEFTEIVGKYKEEKEPVLDGLLNYVLDLGASEYFADDFTIVEVILP